MRNTLLIILMFGAGALTHAAQSVAARPGEEYAGLAAQMGIDLPKPAPPSGAEAQGPFSSLLIKNVMVVNGEGAPPNGPLSILIRDDRIAAIGARLPADEQTHVIDGAGMYALPGFIDAHTHIGNPLQGLAGPVVAPEYVFKLWLGHGVTTVRETGSLMGLGWTVDHRERSARGEITAPDIVAHAMFPGDRVVTEKDAREWVRQVRKRGADGVKLRGTTAAAARGVYRMTAELGMGTSNHHDQNGVYHVDVLDSARMGLDSMEHWYGLPEAMFEDRRIQDYPPNYNYADEQWRFGEAGRLWQQATAPGSEKWNSVRDELVGLNFTLVPTLTIYEANRDVTRALHAPWHEQYTMPALQRFFMPDPRLHGSYHFDWTTADEVAWRENFRLWMRFVNDYKNAGGRVATGSDAGFIFKLYGFAYIRELEMLQEAGFHPLEVVQAATLNGAELLGIADETGSLVPGKKADLVLLDENPVANFKVLYGTGHMRLDRDSGKLEQVGGVRYTVKDGIVYDAAMMLRQVRDMVRAAKQQ